MEYARESILLALLTGGLASIAGIVLADPLLSAFGCSTQLKVLAVPYIQICSLANVALITFNCQAAILRAIGKADIAIAIAFTSTTISLLGSIATFHLLPNPLGHSIKALAISWILGAFSAMFHGANLINRHLPGVSLRDVFTNNNSLTERLSRSRDLTNIAIPVVAGEFIFTAANCGKFALVAGLPESCAAQAALTIGLLVEETVAILPLMALGYAVAVVCGQYAGAGKRDEIAGVCCRISTVSAAIYLVVKMIVSFAASDIAAILTSDATAFRWSVLLVKQSPVVMSSCAIYLVLNNALEGSWFNKTVRSN